MTNFIAATTTVFLTLVPAIYITSRIYRLLGKEFGLHSWKKEVLIAGIISMQAGILYYFHNPDFMPWLYYMLLVYVWVIFLNYFYTHRRFDIHIMDIFMLMIAQLILLPGIGIGIKIVMELME